MSFFYRVKFEQQRTEAMVRTRTTGRARPRQATPSHARPPGIKNRVCASRVFVPCRFPCCYSDDPQTSVFQRNYHNYPQFFPPFPIKRRARLCFAFSLLFASPRFHKSFKILTPRRKKVNRKRQGVRPLRRMSGRFVFSCTICLCQYTK